jgi:hypothetical protein
MKAEQLLTYDVVTGDIGNSFDSMTDDELDAFACEDNEMSSSPCCATDKPDGYKLGYGPHITCWYFIITITIIIIPTPTPTPTLPLPLPLFLPLSFLRRSYEMGMDDVVEAYFETKVIPKSIQVFHNWASGNIVKAEIFTTVDGEDEWVTVYENYVHLETGIYLRSFPVFFVFQLVSFLCIRFRDLQDLQHSYLQYHCCL